MGGFGFKEGIMGLSLVGVLLLISVIIVAITTPAGPFSICGLLLSISAAMSLLCFFSGAITLLVGSALQLTSKLGPRKGRAVRLIGAILMLSGMALFYINGLWVTSGTENGTGAENGTGTIPK